MASTKKEANAVGGKTARACDGCVRNRARWFCAADDAFLCQSCDVSVHAANPLASRHERVLLKTSSFKPPSDKSPVASFVPSWHRGLTRRARTPRNGKNSIQRERKSDERAQNSDPRVPELGGGENSNEDNQEQSSFCRVPIFDQFVDNSSEIGGNSHGFYLPSEAELAEFAADVENLLGKGFEEESFDMESLGILDLEKKDSVSMEGCLSNNGGIKVENEEEMNSVEGSYVDMARELPFELTFDFDEEEKKTGESEEGKTGEVRIVMKKEKVLLRLDYEGIMTAWAGQRSPWTTGHRPEIGSSECWPDCMGNCGMVNHSYGHIGVMGGHTTMGDGGREARVLRYREKRRTRLFSKKIRYEVRKLNAEKRPRMKGRFVKRANFESY